MNMNKRFVMLPQSCCSIQDTVTNQEICVCSKLHIAMLITELLNKHLNKQLQQKEVQKAKAEQKEQAEKVLSGYNQSQKLGNDYVVLGSEGHTIKEQEGK